MFSEEARDWFGERFVSLDLDSVIVDDMSPIWDRHDDFVAWGDTNPKTHYNGSMMMMTAGVRKQVWEDFNPLTSPDRARRAGHFGSDQAWISYKLGKGEATWGIGDGVYSYRNHVKGRGNPLPDNARIVIFHGHVDPWSPVAMKLKWVREHYSYTERAVSDLRVQAINLRTGVALLTSGRVVPITNMYDEDGDETTRPELATVFVAGEQHMWFHGAVNQYSAVESH